MTENNMESEAQELVSRLDAADDKLTKKGNRRQQHSVIIRVLLALAGMFAIVFSYVPAVSQLISSIDKDTVSLVVALLLIFSSVIYFLYENEPPTRILDFAKYLGEHSDRISSVLSDVTLNDEEKNRQLKILVDTAKGNLRDAGRQLKSDI